MKKLSTVASLAGSLLISIAASAATYYSQGSLDPSFTSSWNSARIGGGSAPPNFSSGDVFVIQDAHVMTTGATWSLSGSGAKLWIEAGGTLVATNAITLSAATTFQVDDGGTYVHDNAVAFGSSIFQGTELLGSASTVELRNSSTTGPSNVVFGNLVVNLVHAGGNVNLNGAVSTINGNLSIQSTNGFEFRLSTNSSYSLNINGDLIIASGSLNGSNGATAGRSFQVNLAGNFIQSGGTFTHTNASAASQLNMIFTGSGKAYAKTGGTLNSTNMNWRIANGASVTFNNDFSLPVSRSLTMDATSSLVLAGGTSLSIAGTADFNHQNVTLRSTINGTARIAAITGTLSNATNVTAERFAGGVTPRRAWRLLSSCVSGTTINGAWQEGVTSGNPNAGYGTHITGGSSANGFDASGTASIKTYNGSGWVSNVLTSTNTGDITDHQGYMVFVRGDRSINLAQGANATPTNTTLRATGILRQGALNNYVSVSATNYTLMGNPYPSAIDFESINSDHPLLTSFYCWDPNQSGSYGLGGYHFVERTGAGTYDVTPHGGTPAVDNNSRYIPMGAAILIQGPGSIVNVSLNESHKTSGSPSLNYFKPTSSQPNLAANLATASSVTLDGIRVRFGSAYSNNVGAEDAKKLGNNNENVAITRNGQLLVVEKRTIVTQPDTIQLLLSGMKTASYQLKFFPENLNGVNVLLHDSYLGTTTVIACDTSSSISFNVDTNQFSSGNRFRLILQPVVPLPIVFTSFAGSRESSFNKLKWKMTPYSGTHFFEIQRSSDGIVFTAIAGFTAAHSDEHRWNDNDPLTGSSFYRVRVSTGQGFVSTGIIRIDRLPQTASLEIYPNLATGAGVAWKLRSVPRGDYQLSVYSTSGSLIQTKKISVQNEPANGRIDLNHHAKGTYYILVTGQRLRLAKPLTLQ